MRQILGCAAIFAFVALAWGAQPPTARKAPARTTAIHKAAAKRTPARTTTASKKGSPAKRPATTWRNRQMAPTAERYRQIQEALATKGYLRPEEATGAWNQNSIEALKRFQAEQNIESTGKVNSLSLIALGLGPKHEAAVLKPPASIPVQDPPPAR